MFISIINFSIVSIVIDCKNDDIIICFSGSAGVPVVRGRQDKGEYIGRVGFV